jgi:hypothetical protein
MKLQSQLEIVRKRKKTARKKGRVEKLKLKNHKMLMHLSICLTNSKKKGEMNS